MVCGAMCDRLLKYYWRQWFVVVGVDRLSVYKQPHRTNNGAENYHSRLNKGFGRKPKFWLYPPRIQKFIKTFVLDVERLKKGLRLTRANKETEVQRRVTQYTAEFDETQDVATFIKRCRWLAAKKVPCPSSSDEEEEEEGGTAAGAAGTAAAQARPAMLDSDLSSPELTPPPQTLSRPANHLPLSPSRTPHLTCLPPLLSSAARLSLQEGGEVEGEEGGEEGGELQEERHPTM